MSVTSVDRSQVLVVDDDESTRTVVQWQLGDAGFKVAQAGDGLSAMSFMAAEIRTGAAHVPEDLPVIILSGRSGEIDRFIGLDLGADDYLVNPVSPGELAARSSPCGCPAPRKGVEPHHETE